MGAMGLPFGWQGNNGNGMFDIKKLAAEFLACTNG